jgi:hypothetical protein
LCCFDVLKVEVDDDIVGIVNRPVDTVSLHPSLGTSAREALKGKEPFIEIGNSVLDLQYWHDGLLWESADNP